MKPLSAGQCFVIETYSCKKFYTITRRKKIKKKNKITYMYTVDTYEYQKNTNDLYKSSNAIISQHTINSAKQQSLFQKINAYEFERQIAKEMLLR